MVTIIQGDALEKLRNLQTESVNCCVTSPPYFGLRDYGVQGQIGTEETPQKYIERLTEVFAELRRVMKNDGTLWLNIGDSYANDGKWGGSSGGKHAKALHGNTGIGRRKTHTGLKEKELIGIPWMLAFSLRNDGWYLRQDIIWNKPNAMPESVKDRCTKSHEYVFLLSKSKKYFFDADAIREPFSTPPRKGERRSYKAGNGSSYNMDDGHLKQAGNFAGLPLNPKGRNKRDVWSISTQSYKGAHFAVFPEKLVEPCVLAGCPQNGIVIDPFCGSGTTGVVAKKLGRDFIGIELNAEYKQIAEMRIAETEEVMDQLEIETGGSSAV